MRNFVDLTQTWWARTRKPPPDLDIRILLPDHFSKAQALQERTIRQKILQRGKTKSDQLLAAALANARPGQPAPYLCCPVRAREVQIRFVELALRVCKSQKRRGQHLTLFDPADALRPDQLKTLDWRRHHTKLRARLARRIGPHIVVIGFGEIEFDPTRGVWQPHYHLIVFGAPRPSIELLRRRHYPAKRTGPRPMLRSTAHSLPGWLAYMSKLAVFDKAPVTGSRSKYGRISDKRSRQFYRYLARRNPSEFVFAMNCRILKKGQ